MRRQAENRALLSPGDIKDIEAGNIPGETLHAYDQSFAEGIGSGRPVPVVAIEAARKAAPW